MILHGLHLVLVFAGPILLVAAMVLGLLRRAPAGWRWLALAACAAFVFVSIDDDTIAWYIRGCVGDLSLTTLLLLGATVWHRLSGHEVITRRDHGAVFACTTPAGLVLYPLALGAGGWDPYEIGYRPLALLGVLLGLAILGRWRGYRAAAFVPVIVLVWCAGLLESNNLWDYMMDPVVAIYGFFWLIDALRRRLFSKAPPEIAPAPAK
jgi:hypothetical protein